MLFRSDYPSWAGVHPGAYPDESFGRGGRQAGGRQEYPQYGKRGAASVKTAEKGGSINVRE